MFVYREASNKRDNEYHDKATDSIINYEVGTTKEGTEGGGMEMD